MTKAYSNKALPMGTVLREWRIEEVLGVGGFGIVYKAQGIYFNELVAIKEYFPSSISERDSEDTVVPIDSEAEEVHALGLKKFVEYKESPYHGLNFCQGTVSEDLENPDAEIGDVIRWFGSRKKIFNVHFRNIRGHRSDFVAEMFPDEGDIDFVKMLKVYREIQYPYLLMPDHAPRVPGQPNAWRENFPFEFGYIRGLIQAEQHLV